MKKETVKQAKIIPSEDLAVFCDEIAVMLRAGISLPDGMALIAGHSVPAAEKMLLDMQKQMENGSSFSSAMAETDVFPEELTEMAAIGENAGVLEQVMDEMSAHYRRESTVKRQVRNAVLCPVATLVLMAAVLGVLNAKVFPVFTGIFSGLGKEMSDAAATAVSLGGFFAKAAALAAVLTVVCCLTVWVLGTTEKGRKIRNFRLHPGGNACRSRNRADRQPDPHPCPLRHYPKSAECRKACLYGKDADGIPGYRRGSDGACQRKGSVSGLRAGYFPGFCLADRPEGHR